MCHRSPILETLLLTPWISRLLPSSSLTHSTRLSTSDRDIVLAEVNDNGNALYYASDELKSDRDILLVAVNKVGADSRLVEINIRVSSISTSFPTCLT
jgi:hypothetical protein